MARLEADPRISAQTAARYGNVNVDKQSVEVLAFDARGDAPPDVVAGRLPRTNSEIALGGRTMRDLGVHLGSTVTFSVANGEFDPGTPTTPRRMTVVGEALSPVLGESDIGAVGLVTLNGVAASGGLDTPQVVLARVRGHNTTATLRAIHRDYTQEFAADAVPSHIVALHRVRVVPVLGLAAAAVLGTFVLVYVLAVSVRRRTRDLAVLRVIGLPARRLGRVLGWQGALLATGMLIVGLPAGLLGGAELWHRVADNLGICLDVTVSRLVLLVAPLVLLVAIAASWYPARRARRDRIAELLRVE